MIAPTQTHFDLPGLCCCPVECDCERPEPNEGPALMSGSCPVHNYDIYPYPQCRMHGEDCHRISPFDPEHDPYYQSRLKRQEAGLNEEVWGNLL